MDLRHLSMFHIQDQACSRGGVGAALSYEDSNGKDEAALRLFRDVTSHDPDAATARPIAEELEHLAPERLTSETFDRLLALDAYGEPSPDLSEIAQKAQTIARLSSDVSSRTVNEARSAAEIVVDKACATIQRSLDNLLATKPAAVASEVSALRTLIEGLAFPEPDPEPAKKLRHITRGDAEISARRGAIPKKTLDAVQARLINQGLTAYEAALKEACRTLTRRSFEGAIVRLFAFFDEKVRRAAEYERRIEEIRNLLAARSNESRQREDVSRTSVVLHVHGPNANEVLSAMLDRDGLPELVALSRRIRELYHRELQEFVRRHRPDAMTEDSSLVWLISALGPAEAADAFLRVFESQLGDGHSLYALIKDFGVHNFAAELYARAAHTCQLTQRNTERFNVPTASLAIVRLPIAVGATDEQVHNELQEAFNQLGHCTFSSSEHDDVVSVVRLEMGWPIGIEGQNNALSQRYRSACKAGHLPHLLGVLDDSQAGRASQQYHPTPTINGDHHAKD